MTQAILQLQNIHRSYRPESGEVKVLKGLNLSVSAGEKIAITGPSGSGKTTLLNLLSGVDQPDEGNIFIENTNLTQMPPQKAEQFRLSRISMIFQHHHLLPQCTALENILLPTLVHEIPARQAQDKALALLSEMNLDERAHHFPSQLSGGEQLRVAIARALITDPAILLADEPTGFLDRAHGESIVKILSSITDRTLIVVTHADYVAEAMQQRYCLENGKLIKAQ